MKRMQNLFIKKIIKPIIKLLKQGISPEKLAFTVALGIVLSVFPVLGSTTILCTVAAVAFGLNLPAIQSLNYLLYPLQIVLLIPLYKAGDILYGSNFSDYTISQVVNMVSNDTMGAIKTLWTVTLHAMAAWIIFAPIVVVVFYILLLPLFKGNIFQKLKDSPTS